MTGVIKCFFLVLPDVLSLACRCAITCLVADKLLDPALRHLAIGPHPQAVKFIPKVKRETFRTESETKKDVTEEERSVTENKCSRLQSLIPWLQI